MNSNSQKKLEEATATLQKAIVEARRRRDRQEDKEYLAELINQDLVLQMRPLLAQIVNDLKVSPDELSDALSLLEIKAPPITIAPPEVNVVVPEIKLPKIEVPQPKVSVNVPDVVIPKIELPEIKIPRIEVPEAKVSVKMPKEMEVKGLAGLAKNVLATLKKPFNVILNGINRDNPLPVILTDEKGAFYKALMTAISGGGGGGGISEESPPTSANVNNPSFTLTYTSGDLTGISMTLKGITYAKTLTYTSGDLTAVSAWS